MKPLCLSAILLLFAGCASLVPTDRQRSEAVKSSEAISNASEKMIERTLTITPQSALALPQWGTGAVGVAMAPAVTEQLRIVSKTESDAGSRDSAKGSEIVSIPLFVKLIGLGVGVFVLVGALVWAWRYLKSTGVGQGIALFDDAVAGYIRGKRHQAQQSTNPDDLTRLNAEIAEMEALRGRVKA